MANDSYKTFRVSVRSARVACLVDAGDPGWQATARNIIEVFSRVWGGAYFIIVPTDGRAIHKAFWQILPAYDPDYIWTYYGPGDEDDEPRPALADELAAEIKLRLAPFHFEDRVIKGAAYANLEPGFPYTDVLTVLPNYEHPAEMVEAAGLEGALGLWAATSTGRW